MQIKYNKVTMQQYLKKNRQMTERYAERQINIYLL